MKQESNLKIRHAGGSMGHHFLVLHDRGKNAIDGDFYVVAGQGGVHIGQAFPTTCMDQVFHDHSLSLEEARKFLACNRRLLGGTFRITGLAVQTQESGEYNYLPFAEPLVVDEKLGNCKTCGHYVRSSNDAETFWQLVNGVQVDDLESTNPQHLIKIDGCEGDPDKSQYIPGQPRDERPDAVYMDSFEDAAARAHRIMTGYKGWVVVDATGKSLTAEWKWVAQDLSKAQVFTDDELDMIRAQSGEWETQPSQKVGVWYSLAQGSVFMNLLDPEPF